MSGGVAGKVVVLTGASSGIGESAARMLAVAGATVMMGARREERLSQLKREITAAGGVAEYRATDVAKRGEVQALVDAAIESFGRVDVMINNAGLMANSPLDAFQVDEWDRMIDVNVKGVLYGIAAVLPHMLTRGGGHIINVGSVSGRVIFPNAAPYCGTKFAVHAITEGLRKEVGSRVRVTLVAPGAVFTELSDHITHEETRRTVRRNHETFGLKPEVMARAMLYAIGEPDEVDVNEVLIRNIAQAM